MKEVSNNKTHRVKKLTQLTIDPHICRKEKHKTVVFKVRFIYIELKLGHQFQDLFIMTLWPLKGPIVDSVKPAAGVKMKLL